MHFFWCVASIVQFSKNLKKSILLLADGEFHSGSALSHQLNVTRSAVHKTLQALEPLGVELMAVSGKGYRLKRPLQLLDKVQIRQLLDAEADGVLQHLDVHDQLESTNSYLAAQSDSLLAGKVSACLAECQTAGRGRRGRQWVSPFGTNIYLSLACHYEGAPAELSGLSLACGVAVIRALVQHGIDDVGLKWPNDIYWQDKKLGGILIEVSGESEGPCQAVMGLGLNGYIAEQQANNIEQAWVDLDRIFKQSSHDIRNALVASLLNQLLPLLANFQQQGFTEYIEEWRQYDCMLEKAAQLHIGKQTRQGRVAGIDENGFLLMQDEHGKIQAYASGEVSLRVTNA